jgi:L-2-hydroxyglutarate oxidase
MTYNCIIIGGGIVGLATAYRLLEKHPDWDILLLEKEARVSKHQTGNNSGVIHAGVYYKPGSLKARLSVAGGEQLVAFCREHEVDHDICGKIIIATSEEELPRLDALATRAQENGLTASKLIDVDDIRKIEPHARGLRALHVPTTGIVDYIGMSEALADEIRTRNGTILFGAEVVGLEYAASEVIVRTGKDEYHGQRVVSCAGLHSDRIARFNNEDLDVRIVPFRGEYYKVKLERRDIVKALIYPVPDPRFPFVDVHFTRLVDGGLEAGPNAVLALKREGYKKSDFSLQDTWETISWPGFQSLAMKYWKFGLAEIRRSLSKPLFTKALQRLVPDIREQDLETGGAGVRAQACDRSGKLVDDFYYVRKGRVLHVLNAPSPAATASLAIGSHIVNEIDA